jgi:hypothetical protein
MAADYARLSVAEYHAWTAEGVFHRHESVELIEGKLVEEPRPRSPQNAFARQTLADWFSKHLPAGWGDFIQSGLTLEDSEPEPDITVVHDLDREYFFRHRTPADTGIVVEIADYTLSSDRIVRGRIYAKAGLSVYWLVNIPDRQIEVYTSPQPAADPPVYAVRQDFHPGDAVPVILDGVTVGLVAVADVFPQTSQAFEG